MPLRVGLRSALMLALIPVLLLPWFGLRFVGQMAELTREERRESLADTARSFASALHERRDLFEKPTIESRLPKDAKPLPLEVIASANVDSVANEWFGAVRQILPVITESTAPKNTLRPRMVLARAQEQADALYLLIEADDERYVPPDEMSRTDMLILLGSLSERNRDGIGGLLSQPNAGDFVYLEYGQTEGAMQGRLLNVKESKTGWVAEIELPVETRFLRIRIIDVDYQASRRVEALADSGLLAVSSPSLLKDGITALYEAKRAQSWYDALSGFERTDIRISAYDRQGQLLTRSGQILPPDSNTGNWLAKAGRRTLSWLVGGRHDLGNGSKTSSPLVQALNGFASQQSVRQVQPSGDPYWLLTSAQPVWLNDGVAGALILEQGNSSDLAAGQSALENMASLAALAILSTLIAWFALSSLTVTRIVRLRDATESAIDERGRVVGRIPPSRLNDEIGDLANSYEHLLGRLREHHRYLANLRARLVHELRTPIMVVRSSLENLHETLVQGAANEPEPQAGNEFVSRALGGAMRLERIVASMGEAASLEALLGDSQLERIDLVALLHELVKAYRQAWSSRESAVPQPNFQFQTSLSQAHCMVVPETVAQAVDKLAANAVDFAEPGSEILLSLELADDGQRLAISMSNRGPALPAEMEESLFESMVSVRSSRSSDQSHLGLGLYLVRLIAEFHGGRAFANNLADGVQIGFTLATGRQPIRENDE